MPVPAQLAAIGRGARRGPRAGYFERLTVALGEAATAAGGSGEPRLTPGWRPESVRRITWTLELTRHDAETVVHMGPAARHLEPDLERRLAALPEPVLATVAIELRAFRRARG